MKTKRGNSERARSAVDLAVQRICDYISAGRFVAGQRLPEVDLVGQIGVSKTVLREAFAKLQQEGIIELQKYRGAMVRRLSLDEVQEILAASTVLMAWAAHEAAKAISLAPSRAAGLRDIRTRLQTLDPPDQREHLATFYDGVDAIVDLAGSPYLGELINRGLNPLVKEFLLDSISFKPEVIAHTRDLDAVMACVEQGKPEAAFDAFRAWARLELSWVRPLSGAEE